MEITARGKVWGGRNKRVGSKYEEGQWFGKEKEHKECEGKKKE